MLLWIINFFFLIRGKQTFFFLANRWMVQGNHTKNAQNETGCNERALVFTHKSGALQHVECKVTGQSLRCYGEFLSDAVIFDTLRRQKVYYFRKEILCMFIKCKMQYMIWKFSINFEYDHYPPTWWSLKTYIVHWISN